MFEQCFSGIANKPIIAAAMSAAAFVMFALVIASLIAEAHADVNMVGVDAIWSLHL